MNDLSHISFLAVDPPPVAPGGRLAGFRPAGRASWKPRVSPAPQAAEMEPLMAWMLGQAGLNIRAYRPAAMQRRLPACLRQLRVSNPDSARSLLQRRPDLLPFALSIILIGVSDFFRDAPVFDYLRDSLLPGLLKTRSALRICSVGASGGHELYSVAMLLAEARALDDSELLGIDCRSDAITRAAAGFFGAEEMAGVDPLRRERFFQVDGGRWQVRPGLRRRLRWQTADLFTFQDGGEWDIILFRNVAIYFDESHATEAWERLNAQLAPGGFLVTGKAEKPPASLSLSRVAPSIYQKSFS